MIEALHQERHPGESCLDPDHRQFRETLAHPVHHPICQVENIVEREAQCMGRDEAVAALENARFPPVETGVERECKAALLDRAIDTHIGIVIDRHVVTHGGAVSYTHLRAHETDSY